MRVCILVNEYPPDRIAGTAIATQAIVRHIVRKGIETFVVVTERSVNSPPREYDEGVVVRRLNLGRIRFLRYWKRIVQVRKIVKEIQPDILHAQSISCGLYAAFAAKGRNLPVLTSIQGRDLYEASALQKATEVRWALNSADQVITVNQELAELGKKISCVKDIQVVHNGFEPELNIPEKSLLRKKFNVGMDEFILICIARLIPVKGIDILLTAFKDIPDAQLWIIGDGVLREDLQKQAEKMNLYRSVKFFGQMDHRSLIERLKAADLFVLPSRCEPFGIVLLEAMSVGLPIIATRVGGIPELVGPENGILVATENPNDLAAAIRTLMANSILRHRMSLTNEAKAANYHWDSVGNRYVALYGSVLERKRNAFL